MARPRRAHPVHPVVDRHGHGRGMRSPVTGAHLPRLHSRGLLFEQTLASAAAYLKRLWPTELTDVRFEISPVAIEATSSGVRRWRVYPDERRIVFYRVPMERLTRLHRRDDLHRRMFIESCVFRAVAELLGKDPWDLAPERFRHF